MHLFLFISFQFSFFLWTKQGLFLFFPFAFIFFSFETHIYSSLLEYDLRRTMTAKPRLRSYRLADEIVQRHRKMPPTYTELQRFRQLDSKQTDTAFFGGVQPDAVTLADFSSVP